MKKALAYCLFLLLVAFVVPDLMSGDTRIYLSGASCFLRDGLHCAYRREPFYPWVLSWLAAFGPGLALAVPWFQNLVFAGALFFFSVTVGGGGWVALLTLLTPTFWLTMNGAIYTESVTASLILIELAILIRLFRRASAAMAADDYVSVGVLGLVAACLTLTKGSLYYSQIFFAVLAITTFFVFKRFRARIPSRKRFFFALAVLALTPVVAQKSWLWVRPGISGLKSYERGGAVLYGRTEYARHFDFKHDTGLYLLNAFSESACKSRFGKECYRVSFEAENELGNQALGSQSEGQLFGKGKQELIHDLPVEMLFVPFEWSRFLFYQGTTGFARLKLPVLGAGVHSKVFNGLLKIFSLLTWLVAICAIMRGFKRGFSVTRAITLLYIAAYLAVYGFATTVVRMVYPVTPLLTYFFWLAVIRYVERKRVQPAEDRTAPFRRSLISGLRKEPNPAHS